MDWIALGCIAGASLVNTVIPGPCVALTLARSASGGIGRGLCVVAGVLASKVVFMAAALATTRGAIHLPGLGVASLRWLGTAALFAVALHILAKSFKPTVETGFSRGSEIGAGFAVGLSSPFNLVFFLALVPLYVDTVNLTRAMAVLVVLATMTGTALALLCALAAGRWSRGLLGTDAGRWIERIGAASLIGFALAEIAS